MTYFELKELGQNWKGKICFFGAGLIGRTWAYDLFQAMGIPIDFFCDNKKEENIVIRDHVKTISLQTLYSFKSDVMVFCTMSTSHQSAIREQLEKAGLKNIIPVDSYFLQTFMQSLEELKDETIKKQFKCILDDAEYVSGQFKYRVGYELDLKNPKTLNEKIQWLKLYDRKPEYTLLADKFAVRQYVKEKFGEEYLIPLLFKTTDSNDLTYSNMPDQPCIVKTNHGTGDYQIIRDKNSINWEELRQKFKRNLAKNLYYATREFQYKNISPLIIVEKLLVLPNGRIPNDYKLHFFNGRCEFIYCSIDREGENYRKVYDINWNPLDFVWVANAKNLCSQKGADIPQPKSFKKMLEIGKEVSRDIRYVRVDFYDVEGKLYCGEITLHHGGGYDTFYPEKYDAYYGQKLSL